MPALKEDKRFYASPAQRELLLRLLSHPDIENEFFLTGGTALAVFYLHHRTSEDLDFFTLSTADLPGIDFWIRTNWPKNSAKIKEGPSFLSFLIEDNKVVFVIDPLSNKEERPCFIFESGRRLYVDTIANIASNKFSTIVSRVEPKDFIDFYCILTSFDYLKIEEIYNQAKAKDAIFDDPPTAAFQLEEALASLEKTPEIFLEVAGGLEKEDFERFYRKLADWLYRSIKIG